MFVFAGTMAVLFMPKILGFLGLLRRSSERRGCGGMARVFASLIFESLVSGLQAPIMMLCNLARSLKLRLAGIRAGSRSVETMDKSHLLHSAALISGQRFLVYCSRLVRMLFHGLCFFG